MGRFAAARHGVLSRDRALALGATGEMIRGRLESGRWRRLHPGIYGLNGARHLASAVARGVPLRKGRCSGLAPSCGKTVAASGR